MKEKEYIINKIQKLLTDFDTLSLQAIYRALNNIHKKSS